MIFNGYENHLTERLIDLALYVDSHGSTDTFHENFFKEQSGGAWENIYLGSIINVLFQKNKTDQPSGLIERLKSEDINHLLLIIPHAFIKELIKKEKKLAKKRVKPREFTDTFIKKFIQEFKREGMGYSIIISGSSYKINTDALESWLDTTALIKSLELHINEAYMLGFRDMVIESDVGDSLLFMQMHKKAITIKSECSILIGDNKILRFHTTEEDSIIKITNNSNSSDNNGDSFVDIITENIDTIHSNNRRLQEEYFDHEDFDDFSLSYGELKNDDIDLTIDNTTSIIFSRTQLEQSPRESVSTKPKITIPSDKKIIGTDTDIVGSVAPINFKNRYLVNLNSFLVPYEENLTQLHYHLIRVNNKPILVGASQMDAQRQPLVKVVADITKSSFVVTNLTARPIRFVIHSDKIEYKITKNIPTHRANYIDTDGCDSVAETSEIILQKDEKYEFHNKIEFNSSSIAYTADGVVVEYINFTLGSFDNKLEFSRLYYSHFGTGNIIDAKESLESAGRIYANGSQKILGSILSSRPFVLRLLEDSFSLRNDIKPHYAVKLQTPSLNQIVEYTQEMTISREDLLSHHNRLSIMRDEISLVDISIIPN